MLAEGRSLGAALAKLPQQCSARTLPLAAPKLLTLPLVGVNYVSGCVGHFTHSKSNPCYHPVEATCRGGRGMGAPASLIWVCLPLLHQTTSPGPLTPPSHCFSLSFTHSPSNIHSCCPSHKTGPSPTPSWADTGPGTGVQGDQYSLPHMCLTRNYITGILSLPRGLLANTIPSLIGGYSACWERLGSTGKAVPPLFSFAWGPPRREERKALTPAWLHQPFC